ncbi:FAD:protein FMN transferase [bacterium]|nr:FAD:protein FMN transferase [bacterium]
MNKFILIILIISISACSKNENKKFAEQRSYMHTFVEIQVIAKDKEKVQQAVNKAFNAIAEAETNTSRFIAGNDLSKIKNAGQNELINVSEYTLKCLTIAKEISKKTDGKYDVTIAPLVELWGFGKNKTKKIPAKKEINIAKEKIGSDKFIVLYHKHSVSTTVANLDIDLSSVAKGVAVDAAAETLLRCGFSDFLINAGGDIRTSSSGEKIWQVGIQTPRENVALKDIIEDDILKIKNKAVATSGNYRNYFKEGTNTYSHIINPNTGVPVKTTVLSVTVTAPTCAEADAWATAFFTLTPANALQLANTIPDVECFIIERPEKGDKNFRFHQSKGFITRH